MMRCVITQKIFVCLKHIWKVKGFYLEIRFKYRSALEGAGTHFVLLVFIVTWLHQFALQSLSLRRPKSGYRMRMRSVFRCFLVQCMLWQSISGFPCWYLCHQTVCPILNKVLKALTVSYTCCLSPLSPPRLHYRNIIWLDVRLQIMHILTTYIFPLPVVSFLFGRNIVLPSAPCFQTPLIYIFPEFDRPSFTLSTKLQVTEESCWFRSLVCKNDVVRASMREHSVCLLLSVPEDFNVVRYSK